MGFGEVYECPRAYSQQSSGLDLGTSQSFRSVYFRGMRHALKKGIRPYERVVLGMVALREYSDEKMYHRQEGVWGKQ